MPAETALHGRTTKNATSTKQLLRAKKLIEREAKFIYNAEFDKPGAGARIRNPRTVEVTSRRSDTAPPDVPGHLRHLWEVPLLTPDEEADLFRRMNYLKYRSNVLRSRLNPDRPNVRHMDDIECMLRESTVVRNHIVQANTRLVVSIVRRVKDAADGFDEMISTGNLILIKAAERFDYGRGFRFSTYATHSVQRELYRNCAKKWKRQETEISMGLRNLLESFEDRTDLKRYEEKHRQVDYVRSVMKNVLPAREQRVVNARFGLGSDFRSQTLGEVGEKMGISKERVRQLQLGALDRLRSFVLNDVPEAGIDVRQSPDAGMPNLIELEL